MPRVAKGPDNVAVPNALLEIAKGTLPGYSGVHVFSKATVGTTNVTVWEDATLYVWPTVATPISIVSTSLEDNPAGTGAFTVLIEGLDENWLEQEELVNLNGTTPVVTVGTYIRINSCQVVAGSTRNGAVGDISFSINGILAAKILIGNNVTNAGIYSIPADKTAFVLIGNTSTGQGKEISIDYLLIDSSTPNGVGFLGHEAYVFESVYDYNFSAIPRIPSMTDIELRASAAAAATPITAALDMILVDNTELR